MTTTVSGGTNPANDVSPTPNATVTLVALPVS